MISTGELENDWCEVPLDCFYLWLVNWGGHWMSLAHFFLNMRTFPGCRGKKKKKEKSHSCDTRKLHFVLSTQFNLLADLLCICASFWLFFVYLLLSCRAPSESTVMAAMRVESSAGITSLRCAWNTHTHTHAHTRTHTHTHTHTHTPGT